MHMYTFVSFSFTINTFYQAQGYPLDTSAASYRKLLELVQSYFELITLQFILTVLNRTKVKIFIAKLILMKYQHHVKMKSMHNLALGKCLTFTKMKWSESIWFASMYYVLVTL